MKTDPDRYETVVAAFVAEGASKVTASLKSCYVSDGLTVADEDKVKATSRISVEAVIEFPEIFKGYTLLAELNGVDDIKLWDDIDSGHRCVGRIDWFGESPSTLHLAADLTLDTLQQFRYLLLGCESDAKHIGVTAIGLESIEFQKRELRKGVAVTHVSVSASRDFDEVRERRK